MAVNKKKEENASPDAHKEEKQETEQKPKSSEEKKILGRFNTPEELVGAYKDLEKKLGEQGDELRESREFATVVKPLLDEIRSDPKLFKQLDEKLRGNGEPTETPGANTKGDEKVTVQGENKRAIADLILAKFEDKYKIPQLPPEEARKLRGKIADQIYRSYGKVYYKVDLTKLGTALDDAYLLANKDKLLEKSKLEGEGSATGLEGGIPSISSSPGKESPTLTPEEARVAEKLNLTREQYLEGKKV